MSNYNQFSVSGDFMRELVNVSLNTNRNINPDLKIIATDAVKLWASIRMYNYNKEVQRKFASGGK